MKAAIVAASALLVLCVASTNPFASAPTLSGSFARVADEATGSPTCREVAWPYVPADCMTHAGVRPVRVLRAEAGR